jgi:SagB-type dehydrogenase family enzyme
MPSNWPDDRTIDLPERRLTDGTTVAEAIEKRRSVRSFRKQPLDLRSIGQLLWSAQGIVTRSGLRTAPSAGALYPLEVYAVLPEGVYHYEPKKHRMTLTAEGDRRTELRRVALDQASITQAPLVIVLASVDERITKEYGPTRGERYIHNEIGHAAQNVHLQAAALGLGSVPMGAFHDARVQKVLGLPREERPLYLIPVGFPL